MHILRFLPAVMITLMFTLTSTAALAEEGHGDIELSTHDGHLHVDEPHAGEIWHSLSGQPSSSFQDIGFNEYQTTFPGFDGLLSPNATVKFELLDRLYYYNPDTQPFFGDTPNGEIVEVTKGNEYFAWTDAGVSIFQDFNDDSLVTVATLGSDGELHSHVNFTLIRDNANAVPADGAYLASFRLHSDLDGHHDEPIWALWNKGLDATQFDQAIAAAESYTVVPEPASALAMLALGGAAMLRRRRRVIA
ncbi:MAG: PEP-CTERM sorting domain-containing protein [Phycisphaeraceae bacterium]